MEGYEAFMLFFSGALAHMMGVRVFQTWSKQAMYHITFINCLAVLKFANDMSRDLMKIASPKETQSVEIMLAHWQKVALISLKTIIPDKIWHKISVEDWSAAERLLQAIQTQGVENERE